MYLRVAVTLFLGWVPCFIGCGAPDVGVPPAENEPPPSRRAEEPPPAEPAEDYVDPDLGAGQTHLVRPGETLYSISRKYYGSETQWRKIYYANQRRLTHPDEVPAGIRLIIP